MIPYKTSKDYKRLKELLDEGKKIIIIIDGEESVLATIRVDEYSHVDYIMGKASFYYYYGGPLELHCEVYNIEFIEPNL